MVEMQPAHLIECSNANWKKFEFSTAIILEDIQETLLLSLKRGTWDVFVIRYRRIVSSGKSFLIIDQVYDELREKCLCANIYSS